MGQTRQLDQTTTRAAARSTRGRGAIFALVAALTLLGGNAAGLRPAQAVTAAGKAVNFTLVGHDSLFGRGENAAMAIDDHYAYIGSRSDGSHLYSGVQVVDIADPAHPRTVGQIPIPVPLTLGYTSRELRVWPEQHVLIVMYFGCSAIIHACVSGSDATGFQPLQRFIFFDLSGANARAPKMVSTYTASTTPHEMFLWVDPVHAGRALLYFTSPNNTGHHLIVTDLSNWRAGKFPEVAYFTAAPNYSAAELSAFDVRLHSLSVSNDGTRAYLAYLGGGVLIVDTTDLALAAAKPVIHLVTPVAGRAFWDVEGSHSTVVIPGTNYLLSTEEIYPKGGALSDAFGPAFHGCPWGWMRVIDASNPAQLKVVSEYKIAQNTAAFCAHVGALENNFSAYTSHNPTVLHDLAFITWHSGGLQAVDLADPLHPTQAGYFLPTPDPLTPNHTADPALELGSNGVIAWSYPIIRNGLIYFIDIRNGLYIVRYSGRNAGELQQINFYEGNSNVGDAAKVATLGTTPAAPAVFSGAATALVPAASGSGEVAALPNTRGEPSPGDWIFVAALGLGFAARRLRKRR